MDDTVLPSKNIVVGLVSTVIVLLLWYPWLVLLTFLAFITGYAFIHYFDSYSQNLDKLVEKWTGLKISERKVTFFNSRTDGLKLKSSASTLAVTDPLSSHDDKNQSPLPQQKSSSLPRSLQLPFSSTTTKNIINKNNDHIQSSPAFTPTPYHMPKIDDLNLKINPRLDASISKFVSTVFDYYVGSEWAPYLTRRQLKVAFKQLLTNLGERLNGRLSSNPNFAVELSKNKLIPLILDYVVKMQTNLGGCDAAGLIFPIDKQQQMRLRVRRLSRMIILQCMQNEDEKKCKLWVELCIAVLADGVFWNLFVLGRDQIPELVTDQVKSYLLNQTNNQPVSQHRNKEVINNGYDEVDNITTTKEELLLISFLLDNFLDPKDSLEQPDPICSRWRPTLKEIVEETDLLYPLIQYLKYVGGQKALAYLQAVLDDSPDAKEHCRRVLEVEYLPGFCRSNFFHESMGLSRVEQGTEVVTEGSPGMTRKLSIKGHSRSASYGNKNNQGLSDILRIEGGVVEGLPLYCDVRPERGPSSISSGFGSSVALSSNDVVETDSFFRRKPPLEDIVSKFLKDSLLSPQKLHKPGGGGGSSSDSSSAKSVEGSPKHSSTPRVGTDSKSYKDYFQPEVTSRVKIDGNRCDVLQIASDIVMSTVSTNSWLAPVLSCWLTFLDPYLQPHFNQKLEEALKQFLTLDLFITSVNLITDAFNSSGTIISSEFSETRTNPADIPIVHNNINYSNKDKDNMNNSKSGNSNSNASTRNNSGNDYDNSDKTSQRPRSADSNDFIMSSSLPIMAEQHSVLLQTLLKSLLDVFISKVVSVDKFLDSLSMNRDYIFLFFVDVLDLLVFELFGDCCDIEIDERKKN